jgi:hypothetical protein
MVCRNHYVTGFARQGETKMDVNAIASAASQISQAGTADAVSIAVLKKALDLEAQSAALLVQAATQPMQTSSNPPNLGNRLNTFA